jgi:hypothetical protein
VESCESCDGNEDETNETHHDKYHNCRVIMEFVPMEVCKVNCPNEGRDHVNGKEDEEAEKVSIVSSTNAIIDPRTVVVKGLDTSITVGTV